MQGPAGEKKIVCFYLLWFPCIVMDLGSPIYPMYPATTPWWTSSPSSMPQGGTCYRTCWNITQSSASQQKRTCSVPTSPTFALPHPHPRAPGPQPSGYGWAYFIPFWEERKCRDAWCAEPQVCWAQPGWRCPTCVLHSLGKLVYLFKTNNSK